MLTINITASRLRSLLKDEALLAELRVNGVDNWCGWGDTEYIEGETASEYADRLDDMTDEELVKQI